MRRSLIALWLIALMPNAFAADYELPSLRGPTPFVPEPQVFTRWSGYYVGAQAGYAASRTNFANIGGFENIFNEQNCITTPWSAANPVNCLVSKSIGPVSNWGGKFRTGGAAAPAYGVFGGYNSQWDDAVLGIDFNYNHTSLSGASTFSTLFQGRAPGDTTGNPAQANLYDIWAGAGAVMKIRDYATMRTRAGWAFDDFMPYAAFGLAVGRADIVRLATASFQPSANSPALNSYNLFDSNQQSPIVWGYSAGVGVDWALGPNVFLRAEYEFVQFTSVPHVTAYINAFRAGAGYRF
jgi:outer membrane immunogenic protein